jgi:type VI secretion system secreted protein VgrG
MPLEKATQDQRPARIETALGKDVLLLVSFSVSEELCRPFEIDVRLQSERDDLQAEDILGTKSTITIDLPDGTKRYFHGVVEKFKSVGFKGNRGFSDYRLLIVPEFALLKHTSDCRVFANMTVPQIVCQLLGEHDIAFHEKSLHDPDFIHPIRRFCVQYRESVFDFVNRLLEFAGIYYHFTHSEDENVMVLNDTSRDDHFPFSGYYESIRCHGVEQAGEAIHSWESEHSLGALKYVLDDYDYTEPKTILLTDPDTKVTKFSKFDCPGVYTVSREGDGKQEYAHHYARIRLDYEKCRKAIVTGSGNVLGMGAGYLFTPIGEVDSGTFLTTKMSLSITLPEWTSLEQVSSDPDILCDFEALPKMVYFRPHRITPKPVIAGLQTAVVVGPEDWDPGTQGPFTDDKIGSVYVQFRWDRHHKDGRDEQGNVSSSIPVRVARITAGNGWGAMYTPYIGNEVIVIFEEGNPDRPVIVGGLYNMINLPKFHMPQTKFTSYFLDQGGNLIAMNSQQDQQHMILYTNYPSSSGFGIAHYFGYKKSQ